MTFIVIMFVFRPDVDAEARRQRKHLKHQAQKRRFQRMRNERRRIRAEGERARKRARQGRRDKVRYMNEDMKKYTNPE